MVDFFKFKENLEEAKAKNAKNKSKMTEDELEKDEDDPCWTGYVQLGTKMKDGKEVPNCVPMEQAVKEIKEKLEKDEDDPCQAGWVQLGMKTKNGRQVPNCVPMDEAKRMVPEAFEDSSKNIDEMYYDIPDYGPIGASEMKMTQLHFIKYAADEIIRCLESGCIMPEWYQNKVAKVEGEVEGLLSYMKGKKAKGMSRRYSGGMYEETLTEAKSGDKEAYRKFFNKALKKFGVDSPAELKGDKEKEFYDYVDKNWKADKETNESVQIDEKLKPSDDVSKWIEDFYKSDAPQFKGKSKEERREMAVAAWLDARRDAGYDVGPNPNE